MARSRFPWRRVERGVYRTDDGWAINADWNIDEAAEANDPTYRPDVFEWYLYDAEGDLIDAFPTLKAAKASAELRRIA